MLFDLHVHTRLSPCSRLSLRDVLAHAGERGLDGVCITDHDTMEVRNLCSEGIQPDGLCVIFGMEYATSEGDFLVFAPEEPPPGLAGRELLQAVDKKGGVAVAAHPFRRNRSVMDKLIREGCCRIVEGVNGRNRDFENRLVLSRYRNLPVSFVGGSDAHALDELGNVATRIYGEIRSRHDFISVLRSGNFSLHNQCRFSVSWNRQGPLCVKGMNSRPLVP